MGGGSQPSTTTQINKTELPKWVEDASQENYGFAKEVAGRPYEEYTGKMVASPSSMTTAGYDLINKNVGSTDAMTGEAADYFRKAAGPLDINKFLNPYTQEVENRAVGNAERSLGQQLQGVNDKARAASAFGGSRAAIERGVTRSEGVRGIGDLTANLRKSGLDYATTNAIADRGQNAVAGQGLLSTVGTKKATELQDVTSLLTGGQGQQAQEQAELDAARRKFDEKKNYPLEQLNTRLAALGMSPYGKTETMTKTGTSEKQGTDWATTGLGVMKMLMPLMMMSDRDTKTDIKLVGKDKKSGLKMYSYRYKDDPKTYPKVVGPMAQDIEKKYPKTVKKVGGHKVVDINNLMEVLS